MNINVKVLARITYNHNINDSLICNVYGQNDTSYFGTKTIC